MNPLRKHSPLLFLLLLAVTVGWWSGYANRLFRYEAVTFHERGQERRFTSARLWHDYTGSWRVEGIEGRASFPRASGVAMQDARIAPGVGYITVLIAVVGGFALLWRWSTDRKENT